MSLQVTVLKHLPTPNQKLTGLSLVEMLERPRKNSHLDPAARHFFTDPGLRPAGGLQNPMRGEK